MESHTMDNNKRTGNKRTGNRGQGAGGTIAVPEAPLEPMSEARVKDCLKQCALLTEAYVLKSFHTFWQEWVGSVEKREENARSNKEQVALKEMVKHLQQAASRSADNFMRNLASGFEQFRQQKLHTPIGQERFRNERLTLVDNAELEETIAITSICHRADTLQAEILWALQQRLALLNEGKKIDERGNPVSPIQFCEALRHVMADLVIDTRSKVIGYKHFEANLIKPLGGLYEEINAFLAGEGILENLRYSAISRPDSDASEPDVATVATELAEPEEATAPQEPARRRRATDKLYDQAAPQDGQQYQQGLVSAIRLLQTHIAQGGLGGSVDVPGAGGSADGSTPGASAAPAATVALSAASSGAAAGGPQVANQAQLVGVMQSMQMVAAHSGQAFFDAEAVSIPPVAVADITQQLVTQLQAEGQDNLLADDMHIIELVGLLFEYILSDEQLPDSVKALLSYLHTPVLKLAFIDKDFFDKVDHPARLLLNVMAESGARWVSNDGTSQYDIYAKIKTTVFSVLEKFGNDVKVFTEALLDFNNYVRNVSRRQELMEKRAMEKAQGEEKLREAKLMVNTQIHSRIAGKDLPSAVLLLLLLPWSDYLAFVVLRYGQESDSCHQALRLVDELLWSIEPKTLQADKVRQLELQEKLQQMLQVGFETIGYEQAKARKLLDAVASLQKLALQSRKIEPAPEPMRNKLESMAAEKAGNISDKDREITAEEAQLIEKLKLIEFGTWLENDSGKRLKVAWYNHKTMHYMLVDQQGRKVSMASALQLARDMIAGKLRVIAGSAKPFFERALENIYHSLNAKASGALLNRE